MTGRTVPEWVAQSPDVGIPPRVKVRVFERAGGRCQSCGRRLGGSDRPEFDHIIPLANGGEHRESNLQVLCPWCHGAKTKEDVKKKAKGYRVRKKHYGVKKPRTITKWRLFNGEIKCVPRER